MPYHENVLTVSYKLVCFAVMSLFLLSGYAALAQTTDSTAMAAAQLPVIIQGATSTTKSISIEIGGVKIPSNEVSVIPTGELKSVKKLP